MVLEEYAIIAQYRKRVVIISKLDPQTCSLHQNSILYIVNDVNIERTTKSEWRSTGLAWLVGQDENNTW